MKRENFEKLRIHKDLEKYGFPLNPPQTEAEWTQYDEAMHKWAYDGVDPNLPKPKFREIFFGTFIREKREEKDWSLKNAAEKYGIGSPYLSDIEKRKQKPPSRQTVIRIASALGMDLKQTNFLCSLAESEQTGVAKDKAVFMRKHMYVGILVRMLMGLKEDFELEGKPDKLADEYIDDVAIEAIMKIEEISNKECPRLYGEGDDSGSGK